MAQDPAKGNKRFLWAALFLWGMDSACPDGWMWDRFVGEGQGAQFGDDLGEVFRKKAQKPQKQEEALTGYGQSCTA